ncbi:MULTISPECIES: DUF917 family protein [unclassified Leptolyngbya]|uniref:S-methyl thiohydantoin desulfurase domain-containing protein n=1 Tax=unclassified Leptolyngbya TaxID=2650499 RepID=UPI0016893D55|nr:MULTISPECIES: DUF917 family protein [unclassified Leptolyngbya]MBD1912000.1 DUF917 family protein [Leptolyngbya sp. FACHB-8]MBD2155370.1 DUF917 family protein [Leptolyngbya sp. FACHB-16]
MFLSVHHATSLNRYEELPVQSREPRTPLVRPLKPISCNEAVLTVDHQSLQDLLDGAAFLSVGGGGPKSMGRDMLGTLDPSQVIPMVGVDQVGDDQWVVMSAYLGSPIAAANLKSPSFNSLERCIRALEKSAGVSVSFVVPGEIGAVNSIAPILAACDLGVPVVDADGCGRAVPLIAATTFGLQNELIQRGGAAIANDANDPTQYQSAVFQACTTSQIQTNAIAVIGSSAYGLLGAIATWLMKGSELKKFAVPGGLSNAIAVGAAIRQSQGNYLQDVQQALKTAGLKSRVLGGAPMKPLKMAVATQQGHDHATLTLQVSGSEEIVTVYMVNENILAYSSKLSQPVIMAPDMLAWLGLDGSTFDNSELAAKIQTGEAGELYAIGIEATQPIGAPSQAHRIAFRDDPGILKVMQAMMEDLGYAGSYVKFQA